MSVAAKVAQHKEAHPERYCPATRCLWQTGGGWCPRHKPPGYTANGTGGVPIEGKEEKKS